MDIDDAKRATTCVTQKEAAKPQLLGQHHDMAISV